MLTPCDTTIFSGGDDRTYSDVMHSDVLNTIAATCGIHAVSDDTAECDVMANDVLTTSADTCGIPLFMMTEDNMT